MKKYPAKHIRSYGDIFLYYDKNIWIKACEDIKAKDNYPKNRDEIRAYYDSTKDIESYKHSYFLVRIMHGQIDFEKSDAVERLKALLPKEIFEERNELDNSKNDKIKGMYVPSNI